VKNRVISPFLPVEYFPILTEQKITAMALPYLFWWLSQVTIVAAFIISLLYCFRKYNPFYLRLFPFYHLTRLIAEGTLLLAIINGTDLHSGSLPASHGSFAFFESLFFSFII